MFFFVVIPWILPRCLIVVCYVMTWYHVCIFFLSNHALFFIVLGNYCFDFTFSIICSGAGAHLFKSWAIYLNRSIILTPEVFLKFVMPRRWCLILWISILSYCRIRMWLFVVGSQYFLDLILGCWVLFVLAIDIEVWINY